MLNKILLPVGDTHQSRNAIRQAAAFAKAFSTRLDLLGMVQPSITRFADPVIWNTARIERNRSFNDAAAGLQAQSVETHLTILDTLLIPRFMRFLDDHAFDLIVVSDEDRVVRTLMRDVLAHTSVPVLFAHNRASSPIRRILVPLDGSRRAECVLPIATVLAQSMGASLLLAHIMDRPAALPAGASEADAAQIDAQEYESCIRYLRDLSGRVTVPTEIINVPHASVASGLQDLIKRERVDLVTLSAHGSSGKPDQFMGSIASSLIDHAPVARLVLQDLPHQLTMNPAVTTAHQYAGIR
jgi:nucleotide-binding universal stress UspA family protein